MSEVDFCRTPDGSFRRREIRSFLLFYGRRSGNFKSRFRCFPNKPIIYAANLCEADFTGGLEGNPFYQQVLEIAQEEQAAVLPICAKIEEEMADMDPDDKAMFLAELNLNESGLDRIIKEGYSLLGLISFLTSGSDEVRAWTITRGTKAPQAAGKIHTDFGAGIYPGRNHQF